MVIKIIKNTNIEKINSLHNLPYPLGINKEDDL